MPSINELCLPCITSDTTLEERTAVCLGLRKEGWTMQQAEVARVWNECLMVRPHYRTATANALTLTSTGQASPSFNDASPVCSERSTRLEAEGLLAGLK